MKTVIIESKDHFECMYDTVDWITKNISTSWIISITHIIKDSVWITTITYK